MPEADGKPVGEVTQLLRDWNLGARDAFERLVPVAYSELHAIAAGYLSRERAGGTLQATVLVHELYLKLLKQRKADFQDRHAFFRFAASLMRKILVDHARARLAEKRGAEWVRVPLSEDLPFVDAAGEEMLDLNRALDELAASDPRQAQLVELCCFLGCSQPEAAELLGVSLATVERDFRLTRAWLSLRMRPGGTGAS